MMLPDTYARIPSVTPATARVPAVSPARPSARLTPLETPTPTHPTTAIKPSHPSRGSVSPLANGTRPAESDPLLFTEGMVVLVDLTLTAVDCCWSTTVLFSAVTAGSSYAASAEATVTPAGGATLTRTTTSSLK